MTTSERPLEQIALNAIRWRAKDGNDGKNMMESDRRWLLDYIDRATVDLDNALAAERRATVERITDWVADNSDGNYGGSLADKITARFLDAEATP